MFFRAEIKKIFRFPLFWLLTAACILFNFFVIVSNFDTARNGVRTVNTYLDTGRAPEGAEFFCENYDEIKETAYDTYYKNFDYHRLVAAVRDMDAEESSPAMTALTDKIYARIAARVEQLKQSPEAREDYYPGTMFGLHEKLYGTCFFLFIMEGCLIGILMTSYLLKYEELYDTCQIVYSTKKGRKLLFAKGLASAAATLAAVSLLLTASVLFFLLYVPQSRAFLASSVACAMATESRGLFRYPFLTWVRMSQGEYLLLACAVTTGYALLASLFAFLMSFLTPNAYLNTLLTVLVYVLLDAQWFAFGKNDPLSFLQVFNPAIAMQNVSDWFMEYVMNPQMSYPGYETLVLIAYILLALLLCLPLWRYFRWKDMK